MDGAEVEGFPIWMRLIIIVANTQQILFQIAKTVYGLLQGYHAKKTILDIGIRFFRVRSTIKKSYVPLHPNLSESRVSLPSMCIL